MAKGKYAARGLAQEREKNAQLREELKLAYVALASAEAAATKVPTLESRVAEMLEMSRNYKEMDASSKALRERSRQLGTDLEEAARIIHSLFIRSGVEQWTAEEETSLNGTRFLKEQLAGIIGHNRADNRSYIRSQSSFRRHRQAGLIEPLPAGKVAAVAG